MDELLLIAIGIPSIGFAIVFVVVYIALMEDEHK